MDLIPDNLVCHECDFILSKPKNNYHILVCPVCRATLVSKFKNHNNQIIAIAISCIIALISSFSFDFLSFSAYGLTNTCNLIETITNLGKFDNQLLAIFLFGVTIIFPIIFIVLMIILHSKIANCFSISVKKTFGKILIFSTHWIMSEVFLVGILVSMVKIMSMADVSFGMSFWAYCIYTILLVRLTFLFDKHNLWQNINPNYKHIKLAKNLKNNIQGIDLSVTSCHCCFAPINTNVCSRCDTKNHIRVEHSLQKVIALLIVAIFLYIPANALPIMLTKFMGEMTVSTIIGGVITLWKLKSYPVAIVIFFASVVVPTAKILLLLFLCWSTYRKQSFSKQKQAKLYRVVEFIGRWSMIDVFVVAVLVALIQQAPMMAFYPDVGALCFGGVVVITMFAAMSFDPKLIWNKID